VYTLVCTAHNECTQQVHSFHCVVWGAQGVMCTVYCLASLPYPGAPEVLTWRHGRWTTSWSCVWELLPWPLPSVEVQLADACADTFEEYWVRLHRPALHGSTVLYSDGQCEDVVCRVLPALHSVFIVQNTLAFTVQYCTDTVPAAMQARPRSASRLRRRPWRPGHHSSASPLPSLSTPELPDSFGPPAPRSGQFETPMTWTRTSESAGGTWESRICERE